MVIKVLTALGRRMDEHSETLNKEMEIIRTNKSHRTAAYNN